MSDAQTAAPAPAETQAPPVAPSDGAPDRTSSGGPAHGGKARLPHTVQTVKHGAVVAEPARESGNVQTLRSSSEPSRSFSDQQRARLANLDKHDRYDDTPADPGDAKAPDLAAAAASAPAERTAPAGDKPTPAPDADLAARAQRLAEHNKRLVTELERMQDRGGAEPDERLQALDAIERGLTTDGLGSIRKLVALNIGAKDAAAPEVDRIMAGLYAEWTAAELKVEMDPARRALLESERNRALIERDKRDREAGTKAEQARAAKEAEARRAADVGRRLDGHLTESKHSERFPLLMKHAQRFDGQTPGELLFSAVTRGIKAGEFPPDTDNDTLINHYSKEIEDHYRTLRDAIAEQPSTAAPAPAPVPPTDKKADATETGVRTITNARASVAPPAPPAKPTTPAETETSTAPKRRTGEREAAFRERLAQHYFDRDADRR